MSNYKGHCAFNVFFALPALVAFQFYFLHPQPLLVGTFIATFVYTTLFMNPDLDLVHRIKLTSLRGIFSLPFRAYSTLFKHRGISHSFFLGSLTRIAWLSGVGLLLFYLTYKTLPSMASFLFFWQRNKPLLLYGFAGICLADWCHLLLDLKLKKIFRK
jgi:uncharacterized metal-binding protein